MTAIVEGESFDPTYSSESARNLWNRYTATSNRGSRRSSGVMARSIQGGLDAYLAWLGDQRR